LNSSAKPSKAAPVSAPASDAPFRWRSIALSAYGPSFLFGIAEGALFPVMALSARALGASVSQAGVIAALWGIGALLSNLPAAMIAARYGERRALVGSAIFCALALLLCLLASHVLWLALGLLLFGMGSSVFLLARHSYLTVVVPLHLRARALSTMGGVMRVGMFIGPFCAAGLMHALDLSGAYWVAVAAVLVAGWLSFSLPDLVASAEAAQTPKPGVAFNATTNATAPGLLTTLRLHGRAYATLGAVCSLVNALRACRQVIVPLWGLHIGLDPATTTLVYGVMGAVDMLLFYPAGRLMDVRGRRWAAVPSMLLMAAGFGCLMFSSTLLTFTLACMVIGLGNGLGAGIVMTLGADISPASARMPFLGGWRLLNDIGSSGGPLLVSALASVASLTAGIALITGTGLVAATLFWHWLPADNQPARVPSA